ncbi:hypothetical protein QBC46DRAFT_93294 [Diplogelasinospora grovesii]|uniref:Uncharacterized protein n=1 Tax=Diplogelasinospora grovesii TaxID=303347 RepID=A0AAN6NI25_9PEZI|nr:hypothetical protein QBC46DRAFT_93294 [Diplogelasinospora grovesii]
MFLHSGASLHGHEYSNRASSPQAAHNLRSPLRRSSFAPTKVRSSTVTEAPTTPPAPALRQRPASKCIPRTFEPVVRFQEPVEEEPEIPMIDDAASDSDLSDGTMSIVGPTSPTPSVPATSTRRRRRRRRMPRKSTTYFLAYPAPNMLAKKKVMQKVLPRLLLQLQTVSQDGRSRPMLEVFPSSRIAGPVIAPRLAKRFPGIFGVKHHLGYDDLVLVRRDDDHESGGTDQPDSDDDEALEKRKLLAVYSPLKHSEDAEIVLDDGSVWVAHPLPSGSYDFVHTDVHGLRTTARWARRSASAAPSASTSQPVPEMGATTTTTQFTSSTAAPQTRFTFSIINPLTRRHPVMATLTPSTLDVQETYTTVSSSYGRFPPTRPMSRTVSMSSTHSIPLSPRNTTQSSPVPSADVHTPTGIVVPSPEPQPERTVHDVDTKTKMLISVTALWVALRSGWSPNYTPSSNNSTTTELPGAGTGSLRSRRNTWSRSHTNASELFAQQHHRAESESQLQEQQPPPPQPGIIKRYSMPLTEKCKERARAMSPAPSVASSTKSSSSKNLPTPRRATSTGAAFMQRRIHKMQQTFSDLSQVNGEGSSKGHTPAAESKRSSGVSEDEPVQVQDGGSARGGEGKRISGGEGQREIGGREAGGENAKKGMRVKILRWFHKLGAR